MTTAEKLQERWNEYSAIKAAYEEAFQNPEYLECQEIVVTKVMEAFCQGLPKDRDYSYRISTVAGALAAITYLEGRRDEYKLQLQRTL